MMFRPSPFSFVYHWLCFLILGWLVGLKIGRMVPPPPSIIAVEPGGNQETTRQFWTQNQFGSLNFIRLVITLSQYRNSFSNVWIGQLLMLSSTSLLLCFNSYKKLNMIFKRQTKKYPLKMSAWYRMALLFSIVIHL